MVLDFLTRAAVTAAHGVTDAAAHGAEAAGHGDSGGLPQLDLSTWPGQIFWLAIAFGVLYLALSRSILPRIGTVIEDRRDKIADDLDEAARLKRQAEDAEAAYLQALADARAKAHAIAGDTRAELAEEIARETQAAEAQFAKKAEDADKRIREATDAALADVKTVAAFAAGEVVAKLIGRTPGEADLAKAVAAAEKRRA